jgi:bacterioferritin-associated ferredoxin
LREREIVRELDAGATTAGEVFTSLGCEPKCCACLPEINAALRARCSVALGRGESLAVEID